MRIFALVKINKMDKDLKTVLITGASTGIGLSAAEQLMNKGMRVYAASRRGGVNQQAINGAGEIIHVKMDVNNEADIAQVISQIMLENNRLEAVVCNAGNGIAGSVEDTSDEEMRYQLETNFFGAVKTIQACLPVFRSQGYGKILITSSVAAIVPIPYQAFYSAGKAAIQVFLHALSIELKPYNIQCSCLLPGDTKTGFTAARKYTLASQLPTSVYSTKMKKSVSKMEQDEQNGMSAHIVAKAIVNQITAKKMHSFYVIGLQYQLIYHFFQVLPTAFRLWIVGKIYG